MIEIIKLLEELKINYRTNHDSIFSNDNIIRDFHIERIKFKIKDKEFSVVFGSGTYGYDLGMLEVWVIPDMKEPKAFEVEEVIKLIKGEQ
jgi:hypothetical protein